MDDVLLKRLRWRCTHRAQRELDVLLGNFLERRYAALPPAQAEAFTALVELEDVELWPLIVGKRACDDAVQAEVLAMLRDARVV